MERLIIENAEPNGIKALYTLQSYLSTTTLTASEKGLISIRASQINGCAYCIDMHIATALQSGETQQRIHLLCAWKEARHLYSEAECVLLAMTEEITLIHRNGLSDPTYEKAVAMFGEAKTAQVIMAVIIINSWNRLVISLQTKPPLRP